MYELCTGALPFMATTLQPSAWTRLHKRGPKPGAQSSCVVMYIHNDTHYIYTYMGMYLYICICIYLNVYLLFKSHANQSCGELCVCVCVRLASQPLGPYQVLKSLYKGSQKSRINSPAKGTIWAFARARLWEFSKSTPAQRHPKMVGSLV